MSDVYRTIKFPSEGIYKEKGSKFLSFAIPMDSQDEIKDLLVQYKKEYYDARHICYAYRLGAEKTDFRFNDDGEPSGTAGKPILGQLLSNDLTNVLIVVVRYFGGVKLGTGGLISAYKDAAADAIANNEIIEKTVDVICNIRFKYPYISPIMRILKDESATILDQSFDNDSFIKIQIRKSSLQNCLDKLQKVETVLIETI